VEGGGSSFYRNAQAGHYYIRSDAASFVFTAYAVS
jgi:hypothetical protein